MVSGRASTWEGENVRARVEVVLVGAATGVGPWVVSFERSAKRAVGMYDIVGLRQ